MPIQGNPTTVYRPDLVDVYRQYNAGMIKAAAEVILPRYGVENQAGEITVITRESLLTAADIRRQGPSAGYNSVNAKTDKVTYATVDRGLEHYMPRAQQEPAAYQKEKEGTQLLRVKRIIAAEKIVADLMCDTGVFTTGNGNYTDVATVWSDAAAPVIANVETACNAVEALTGVRPNVLTVNAKNYSYLLANTGLLNRFPGAARVDRANLAEALAAVLGLEKINISSVRYNSTPMTPGTFTSATVWSDSYASLSVSGPEGAPLETPCVGRTLQWAPDGMGVIIETRYEDSTQLARTDVVRLRENVVEKIFDPLFAHLLKID